VRKVLRAAGVQLQGNATLAEVAIGNWKFAFMVALQDIQVRAGRPSRRGAAWQHKATGAGR
jgi:hypothetical protein